MEVVHHFTKGGGLDNAMPQLAPSLGAMEDIEGIFQVPVEQVLSLRLA